LLRDHPAPQVTSPVFRVPHATPRPSWRAPGSCSCRAGRPRTSCRR
jgi:hypothetical protein